MRHVEELCFVFLDVTLLYCIIQHHPHFGSTVDNVKEVLKLSVEQKGVLVPIGELTVYLDGLTVTDQDELAPLTNGNTANGTSERSIYMLGVGDGKAAKD